MTCSNTPAKHARCPLPAVVLAPLSVVLVVVYPAIWNPAQSVRQVFTTILIFGLIALVLAAVFAVGQWAQRIGKALAAARERQIREQALAELDEVVEEQWTGLVQALYVDPDGNHGP